MKRYLIPIIFFAVGLLLQFWLHFSWITFGLLLISTLLLCLLIFSISEMSTPLEENFSKLEAMEENQILHLPEPVAIGVSEKSNHLTEAQSEPIFKGLNPIDFASEIRAREERNIFVETVKAYVLPKMNQKISSILYAYYDGEIFTECLWQKGQLLIDSEANDIEWEDYEQESIFNRLPCLSQNKQKLYLPLAINETLLGMLCMQTKEKFSVDEVNGLLLSTLLLTEKLFEKKEYSRALYDPKSFLHNKAHFYSSAKDRFNSQVPQTLLLLKLMKQEFHHEFVICLNEFSKRKGFVDIGLFQIEEQLLAGFIPNQNLLTFTSFVQKFVEELDEMGYECEIALGFSSKKSAGSKMQDWIKNAYLSLEESILVHAA